MPKLKINLKYLGFTLIELMIVIVIIAILATIGLVMYTNVQRSARDSKRIQDINAIQNALEQYRAFNGSYPQYDSVINISVFQQAKNDLSGYFQGNTIPNDPGGSGGSTYLYYSTISNNNGIPLCATPKYLLCTGLLEISTNGNAAARPGTAGSSCSTVNPGTGYYCVTALSD